MSEKDEIPTQIEEFQQYKIAQVQNLQGRRKIL